MGTGEWEYEVLSDSVATRKPLTYSWEAKPRPPLIAYQGSQLGVWEAQQVPPTVLTEGSSVMTGSWVLQLSSEVGWGVGVLGEVSAGRREDKEMVWRKREGGRRDGRRGEGGGGGRDRGWK